MDDEFVEVSEDGLPVAACAKLTELRDLAHSAAACWDTGDRPGAFAAVSAAIPVAAAAATALNILLELEQAEIRFAERQRRHRQDGAAAWSAEPSTRP
ncbi:hypothetical protein [Kitasatospora terrestris]|uniref:Uncharacterized protein n=1 Tax=Kitasatospora terrestris TaxID=258051 RepID=A0ABP9ENI3_9ACTN